MIRYGFLHVFLLLIVLFGPGFVTVPFANAVDDFFDVRIRIINLRAIIELFQYFLYCILPKLVRIFTVCAKSPHVMENVILDF